RVVVVVAAMVVVIATTPVRSMTVVIMTVAPVTTLLRGTYGMATDYGIMKEEMSKLSGRKSVPGMDSRKRGKWKEKTTRSLRELHGKELV
nr:hypothetical protein [Tanacetum cinerariifolium]